MRKKATAKVTGLVMVDPTRTVGLVQANQAGPTELSTIMELLNLLEAPMAALEGVADRALGSVDEALDVPIPQDGHIPNIRAAITRLHHRLEAVTQRLERLA